MKVRTRRTCAATLSALTVASLVWGAAAPSQAASLPPACGNDVIALVNAGFDSPAIPASSYRFLSESNVPGWSTTASDRQIELWSAGFGGVQPAEGTQFAELNANMPSALYQDVPTTPGTPVTWSLAHRGRAGVDTMRVVIGPPGGSLREVARLSDGTREWGRHTGTYVVPAGQTTTRFAFEAVSTATGNPTVGNFLDDIAFGTPACVELTKQVTVIGDAVPGSRLRWTVTATNRGGAPATGLTISDSAPLHTAYVPGSLRVTSGPRAGLMTDAADADQARNSGGQLSWTPIGASNIAGRLNPRESASVSFETTIRPEAAGALITNRARASYDSGDDSGEAESNQVSVSVAEVADVYVHKFFDAAAVTGTAGTGPAGFTLVVGNLGPFGADRVVVRDTLPAGMSLDVTQVRVDGVTAGTLCTLTTPEPPVQAELNCLLGDLPPAAVRTITAPATFTKTTPGAVVVENNVHAGSTHTIDVNPDNNLSLAHMVFDPGPASDVTVTVAGPASPLTPGERATWLVEAINATDLGLPSTGVTVTVDIPDLLEDLTLPDGCSATSPVLVTCSVGTLAALDSKAFTISGRVKSATVAGASGTLRATVAADAGSDSDLTNNVDSAPVTVVRPGRLEVRKTALDPVTQERIRFEVTVTSIGDFEARDVVLTDLAAGATAVAYPDGCAPAAAGVECVLGTLEPGASVTLLFEFTTTDYGSPLVNTATATASNIGDPVSATASAAPIVPEFSERSIPGGLPPAPPPPPLAFTGGTGAPATAALLLILAGLLSLRLRRRSA